MEESFKHLADSVPQRIKLSKQKYQQDAPNKVASEYAYGKK